MAKTILDKVVDDEAIFLFYQGRCVGCWVRPAVNIHEIEPRSKRPKDWQDFDNRAPLCSRCHQKVHEGTRGAAEILRQRRSDLVAFLYGSMSERCGQYPMMLSSDMSSSGDQAPPLSAP